MQLNKMKTLLPAALSLTRLIVWFCQRGSDVILKKNQWRYQSRNPTAGKFCSQTEEEKKAEGEASRVGKSIWSGRRKFLERSEGKPHKPSHVLDKNIL